MTYRVDADAGLVFGKRGKPIVNVNGRGYIEVVQNGRFFALAHRLVWQAVHGPIPEGMQVNHINGVKTDNRLTNLELVTPAANTRHAYAMGLRTAVGSENGRARLTELDVLSIRASSESGRALAKKYGVSRRAIQDARSGLTWRHLDGVVR